MCATGCMSTITQRHLSRCSSGDECALLDELEPLPAIGTREALIEFVADRPAHDHRYAIDPSKIELELGWRPRETFDSALRKTVEWYLENREWWERVRAGTYRGERLGLGTAL